MINKNEMHKIIHEAEDAYKKREQAKVEMENFKKEAEQEQQEFQKEWNKLEVLIDQDKKVQDFIKEKEEKKKKDSKSAKIDEREPNEHKEFKESAKPKAVHQLQTKSSHLNKEVTSTLDDMLKVEEYEKAFNSIKEATQINDIDALIDQFEKAENNNFSLLKYVESLSADIKELDEEIGSVQKEIDRYTDPEELDNANSKFQKSNLNEELEKQKRETEEYERQYQETVKTINALKIGIKSIFDRIGCNNESIQGVIGTHGVTESNMIQYLGIIEQRTNEILQMYSAWQVKGPFESTQPKFSQPVQAQPLERYEVAALDINDHNLVDDKYVSNSDYLNLNELKQKSEKIVRENPNKFIKKAKKQK